MAGPDRSSTTSVGGIHDLRHTFGSLAASMAVTTRELQEWMGHADAETTACYTHYRPHGGEARRLARAFQTDSSEETPAQVAETWNAAAAL